jgi:flavin reductase (DIM6/NTAB) family NADH-FMN oxidoreductase RutF
MPITMEQLPLSKVYQLLEPRPVVPLTTARKGLANVMTMSWHMMVNFESPLVACVVSSANYSFGGIASDRQVCACHPGAKIGP